MEFSEVLHGRRSVRSFTDRFVDPGTIQRVIEAAALAPSANNSQPWEFWVLFGESEIQDISRRVQDWLVSTLEENGSDGPLLDRLKEKGMSVLHNAGAMILIVAKTTRAQDDEDCCLAGMTLMLAAREAGLGTCWIGLSRPWFNLPSTKIELGIPEGANVVAPIILGYPAEWPEPHRHAPAKIRWMVPAES
ncbi:MAG TPA: nitroreductase family protein [Acidobacteriaceae bacterium]